MLEFTILSENRTEHLDCKGEFGLSIYVKHNHKKIMFDLGFSDLYYENAKVLGVDIKDVDMVTFSHGHNDHTEGIRSFVRENQKAKIYVHENAFVQTYGMEDGVLDEEPSGISWKKEDYMDRLVLSSGHIEVYPGVHVIGNIPKVKEYAPAEFFFSIDENGNRVLDDMSHEQILVLEEKEGLYVFSGCSHTGIVSIIEHVKNTFPGKKIAGLIAGMHLYPATPELREKVCNRVTDEDIPLVVPVHCTGIIAICMLREKMGQKCRPMCVGDSWNNYEL
ncbi:MAG: MBL fold metallo-hydrolase [Clostridia bacterium]|nr:MBL fold metallo-hydrolase [Clostridia bacterium]